MQRKRLRLLLWLCWALVLLPVEPLVGAQQLLHPRATPTGGGRGEELVDLVVSLTVIYVSVLTTSLAVSVSAWLFLNRLAILPGNRGQVLVATGQVLLLAAVLLRLVTGEEEQRQRVEEGGWRSWFCFKACIGSACLAAWWWCSAWCNWWSPCASWPPVLVAQLGYSWALGFWCAWGLCCSSWP